MSIYRIGADDSFAGFKVQNENDEALFDDYTFEDKIELSPIWKQLKVHPFKKPGKRKIEPIGDFHMMLPVFIVSEKAKVFFENEMPAEYLELLPVDYENEGEAFYALNVIQKIDALDRDKSELSFYSNSTSRIKSISKLELREDVAQSEKLFKIKELNTTFCSENFYQKLKVSGLKGLTCSKDLW